MQAKLAFGGLVRFLSAELLHLYARIVHHYSLLLQRG
jgi:hypothetical protein